MLFRSVVGSEGAGIIEELKPQKQDYIISKRRYSGFFETELDNLLKNLQPENLIITGVCTDICVLYTGADAVMRGYQVVVPKNCVAALSEEAHKWALTHIENVLHGNISSLSTILEKL